MNLIKIILELEAYQATGAKRGKRRVPKAGKLATGAKGGKTCNGCQARENLQQVPRAGKLATGAKGEKQEKTIHKPNSRLVLLFIGGSLLFMKHFFVYSITVHFYSLFVFCNTEELIKISSNTTFQDHVK